MFRSFLLYFFMVLLLLSCSRPTGIAARVNESDSVAINFFKGDGSIDTVTRVIICRDKKQLLKLAQFMESGSIGVKHCGYDGTLHFFKDNQVIQDAGFRMNDPRCMCFSFNLDGRSYSTNLSNEARLLLDSLKTR